VRKLYLKLVGFISELLVFPLVGLFLREKVKFQLAGFNFKHKSWISVGWI
jgi:hypothetical protein